jgi:hypothetical protein
MVKTKEQSKEETRASDSDDFINKLAAAVTTEKTPGNNTDPETNVQLTNKIVDTLFDMVKRKMLGILGKNQIAGIKKLDMINEIMFNGKKTIFTHIINNEIDFSISEGGKGRLQLVKLSKSDDDSDEARASRFRSYLH